MEHIEGVEPIEQPIHQAVQATNERRISLLLNLFVWAAAMLLAVLVAAHLLFFAIRTTHLLGYPYPLDYGEGPLLAQVNTLLAGTPIWRMYADPDTAPFAVVNYPPVYHALSALVALPLALLGVSDPALLAGRLLSLLAATGTLVALWQLVAGAQNPRPGIRTRLIALVMLLALLGIPIMREWSAVMRVDLLGVCFGLWGLVTLQRNVGTQRLLWAAPLLALSLFVKPSLIAAPAAALLWLLFRDWRRALMLGALIGALGGAGFGLLQLASGGWFVLHVLTANANAWDFELAHAFWRDQMLLLQPLMAAGAVGLFAVAGAVGLRGLRSASKRLQPHTPMVTVLLPLYYAIFGVFTAFGIGKLGAYTNYFLELYAGLIWLATTCVAQVAATRAEQRPTPGRIAQYLGPLCSSLVIGLVAVSLIRYYPLWSENYLLPAGVVEGRNPARISFGAYGVWQDLEREQVVLAARGLINARLQAELRIAEGPILTDVPGVAAQARQLARVQMFEHRMLLDGGAWDQRPLLRELANGTVPLVVLDYLGNWLTPEMIALITHRYAQDGSIGTYSIYRPVDPGPQTAATLMLGHGITLHGYSLAPSASGAARYGPGETVLLGLDFTHNPGTNTVTEEVPEVVLQLTTSDGYVLLESAEPLVYGALQPKDWGQQPIQHLQALILPPELPANSYELHLLLRSGSESGRPQRLGELVVVENGGRILGEGGYYVPPPFLEAWIAAGGYEGPGDPVSPAVPFEGATMQCYRRACFKLEQGNLSRMLVGELVWLADAGLRPFPGGPTTPTLSGPFLEYWQANGGEAVFGPPVSGELIRNDMIVQYTRYARLERPLAGGPVLEGTLGDDIFRLPGGTTYRWPASNSRLSIDDN